ncbi:MAG TPA: NADP-dependent oxidoreductase, partial [Candidatus Dormibacteraeota bacterium]|nr:NADP-dependent oxidoreductase [Candidatus Dormibacteraeota bacterium]
MRGGARADMLRETPPPYVPGMDAAGVLEQIGDGVSTDLQVGDHVMAIVLPRGSHGAHSERVVVPAESVARVPAGATDAEAATLPMNGLTARLALDVLGLEPGQ